MKVQGVKQGRVINVMDPTAMGRVEVCFPLLPGNNQGYWAPVATMMAGQGRGSWFMPEIGDDVLVAFEDGDINIPYIIGFLWNGQDQPPRTDPHTRVIQSVNGHMLEISDPPPGSADVGYIRMVDAYGNSITLQNAKINIAAVGILNLDAPSIIISGRPVVPFGGPI